MFTLQADASWLLSPPGARRFDASALLRLPSGTWWTVNDQGGGVHEIRFPDRTAAGTNSAELVPVPDLLAPEQRRRIGADPGTRLDLEGLAIDAAGRIYLCEEARRSILRWNPATRTLDRLDIDWTPVRRHFHPLDFNASFEGIAIDGDILYVANERQDPRIIEVDLNSLKVVGDFVVLPAGSIGTDTSYSDLHWADGSLWILLRDVRKILQVDAKARRVVAEFDYARVETQSRVAYGAFVAPGFMEGLFVDPEFIWLLTDNNGMGRRADSRDIRPTLFRCPRPR